MRPRRRKASLLGMICLAAGLIGGACKETPRKQVTVVDGVEVVANPAVPLHKNPGRVLKAREKLRIRDTGDTFYFKYPQHPEIGPDGSIFIMEWDQLLRFSATGDFLGNLLKPGQGPGEIESLNRYLIEGDAIYAADGATNKVVHMSLDGTFIDERRYEDYFETMTRGWVVGTLVNLPHVRGILADAIYWFFWTSRSGEPIRKTFSFPGKFYVKPPVFLNWDKLTWIADPGRDLLFVYLARDYGIKVLDLNAGRVVRSFSRLYPKVPYVVPENMKAAYAAGGPPKPDFESDVLELFLPDKSLWVRTSTVEAKKGRLFDVFSAEGDFLDSFYVPVKGKILGIRGDTIFVEETAEDGTIAVVLYRYIL
jgi:6-bladed beta-propeller